MRGRSNRTRPGTPTRRTGVGSFLAQDSADGFAQTADNARLLGSDDLAALLSSLEDDFPSRGLMVDVDDLGGMPSAASCSAAMRAFVDHQAGGDDGNTLPSVSCSPLPSSKW